MGNDEGRFGGVRDRDTLQKCGARELGEEQL